MDVLKSIVSRDVSRLLSEDDNELFDLMNFNCELEFLFEDTEKYADIQKLKNLILKKFRSINKQKDNKTLKYYIKYKLREVNSDETDEDKKLSSNFNMKFKIAFLNDNEKKDKIIEKFNLENLNEPDKTIIPYKRLVIINNVLYREYVDKRKLKIPIPKNEQAVIFSSKKESSFNFIFENTLKQMIDMYERNIKQNELIVKNKFVTNNYNIINKRLHDLIKLYNFEVPENSFLNLEDCTSFSIEKGRCRENIALSMFYEDYFNHRSEMAYKREIRNFFEDAIKLYEKANDLISQCSCLYKILIYYSYFDCRNHKINDLVKRLYNISQNFEPKDKLLLFLRLAWIYKERKYTRKQNIHFYMGLVTCYNNSNVLKRMVNFISSKIKQTFPIYDIYLDSIGTIENFDEIHARLVKKNWKNLKVEIKKRKSDDDNLIEYTKKKIDKDMVAFIKRQDDNIQKYLLNCNWFLIQQCLFLSFIKFLRDNKLAIKTLTYYLSYLQSLENNLSETEQSNVITKFISNSLNLQKKVNLSLIKMPVLMRITPISSSIKFEERRNSKIKIDKKKQLFLYNPWEKKDSINYYWTAESDQYVTIEFYNILKFSIAINKIVVLFQFSKKKEDNINNENKIQVKEENISEENKSQQKEDSQNKDNNAQVKEDNNAQVKKGDNNAQVKEDNNSQVKEDNNSQVKEDNNAQVKEDNNAQLKKEDNNAQVKEENKADTENKELGNTINNANNINNINNNDNNITKPENQNNIQQVPNTEIGNEKKDDKINNDSNNKEEIINEVAELPICFPSSISIAPLSKIKITEKFRPKSDCIVDIIGVKYEILNITTEQFVDKNGNGLFYSCENILNDQFHNLSSTGSKKQLLNLRNIKINKEIPLLNVKLEDPKVNALDDSITLFEYQIYNFPFLLENNGNFPIDEIHCFAYAFKKEDYKVALKEVHLVSKDNKPIIDLGGSYKLNYEYVHNKTNRKIEFRFYYKSYKNDKANEKEESYLKPYFFYCKSLNTDNILSLIKPKIVSQIENNNIHEILKSCKYISNDYKFIYLTDDFYFNFIVANNNQTNVRFKLYDTKGKINQTFDAETNQSQNISFSFSGKNTKFDEISIEWELLNSNNCKGIINFMDLFKNFFETSFKLPNIDLDLDIKIINKNNQLEEGLQDITEYFEIDYIIKNISDKDLNDLKLHCFIYQVNDDNIIYNQNFYYEGSLVRVIKDLKKEESFCNSLSIYLDKNKGKFRTTFIITDNIKYICYLSKIDKEIN